MPRQRWFALAALMLSVVVCFAVAEVMVRVLAPNQVRDSEYKFFQYDAELGWVNTPNAAGIMRVPGVTTQVHISSQGWRNDEYPPAAAGLSRTVVLGDSQTWGYGVGDHERYTDELQRLAPHTAVLNMGVSGYGTGQEYLLLRRYLDALTPSTVIVGFYFNDLLDNVNPDNDQAFAYPRPVFDVEHGPLTLTNVPVPQRPSLWQTLPSVTDQYPQPAKWLLQHSRLVLWLARPLAASITAFKIRSGQLSEVPEAFRAPTTKPWRTTFAILDAMKIELDRRGIRLLVVSMPIKFNIERALTYTDDNLRDWSARTGVALLTVSDQFTPANANALFLHDDSHLSAAGHTLLGGLINNALK